MLEKVFYNSSLPRAGSTLIQNILAQNPDIYCSPTSGMFGLLDAARVIYSQSPEFKAQNEEEMKKAYSGFLNAATYGYYGAITDKKYVVDKSRAWVSEYNFLNFYQEKPKIISMIRDLRGVFASLEKKYRKNPELNLGLADWSQLRGTTLHKRLDVFASQPPIGPAVDRIHESILSGQHKHILYIRFEDLCTNPNQELEKIYQYLEIPYFQHDFDNVEQLTWEDDKVHGVFGDHIIRQKVELPPQDYFEVLGEEGCNLITNAYPWFYESFGYQI